MKSAIAILGAGGVGNALASRLFPLGLDVRFGVRNPAVAPKEVSPTLASVPRLSPAAAASGAHFVFLAVPSEAALATARAARLDKGQILVDCTNPLLWERGVEWNPPAEGSQSQALAAALPGVAVIKGFNHFGAEVTANPALRGGPADAFFAGDDSQAKARVMDLALRMGLRPHDAGPLRNAAVLENLAVLWIHQAIAGGLGREFSFRIDPRR